MLRLVIIIHIGTNYVVITGILSLLKYLVLRIAEAPLVHLINDLDYLPGIHSRFSEPPPYQFVAVDQVGKKWAEVQHDFLIEEATGSTAHQFTFESND